MTVNAMAEIRLQGVTKRYDQTTAVDKLDLAVADSSFVVLLGPTGAGKTTTLRLVAGLENADEGSIWVDNTDVTRWSPSDRDVAMVFQQYSLYPHLSVRDNLAFPLRSPLRALQEQEIAERVARTAEMLHISSKLDNRATELSGGEMQRVSIGRALVRDPSVFLMDEPLSSLDAKLRAELRIELKHIQADLGATVLYVTHDQIEAMTMATSVGVLQEGQLVQFGSPREVYEQPRSIYVATRLGQPRINIVPPETFPALATPDGTDMIGLRPENVTFDADVPGSVAGKVGNIEYLGDQTRVEVSIGSTSLITLTHGAPEVGSESDVQVGAVSPLFFDSSGDRIKDSDHV